MAADVVGSRLIVNQGQELITIMDDFGTEFDLYVLVADSANRQSYIDAALTKQSANQAAVESYASTHSIDVSAQKAAGIAKKQALAKANGITLASSTTSTSNTTTASTTTSATVQPSKS